MSSSRRFFFGDLFKEDRYHPLNPVLFDPKTFATEFENYMAPEFVAAVKTNDFGALLTEDVPGKVYSFPCFGEKFCAMLLQETDNALNLAKPGGELDGALERPNGMNHFGLILNQLGFEPFATYLQTHYVQPLAKQLFPEESQTVDDHHCFLVRYKKGEDLGLDMHEDDSEVTLNVCLGREFENATLTFCGMADDWTGHSPPSSSHPLSKSPPATIPRRHSMTYQHRVGRAVIHRGRHRHGADNITSGERINFLLWSLSAHYRTTDTFRRHRTKVAPGAHKTPHIDPICLSYTHDPDFTNFLAEPKPDEAHNRGVMMHQVERRRREQAEPVLNLSSPPARVINGKPCLCVFLDRVEDAALKKSLAGAVYEAAVAERERFDDRGREEGGGSMTAGSGGTITANGSGSTTGSRTAAGGGVDHVAGSRAVMSGMSRAEQAEKANGAEPMTFFAAVVGKGAVPQVRWYCGLSESVGVAVVILDIPKGVFYHYEGDEVTARNLTQFVDSWRAGTLQRQRLQDG